MSERELEPCRYCGGDKLETYRQSFLHISGNADFEDMAACQDCFASAPIDIWNRLAPSAEQQQQDPVGIVRLVNYEGIAKNSVEWEAVLSEGVKFDSNRFKDGDPIYTHQQPQHIRDRWNIEQDGDDLLICFNYHEKGDSCDYERYVPESKLQPQAQGESANLILKGIGKIDGDGWKDVTKKGEVVFVWNAELPEPYAPGQFPRIGKNHWSASRDQYDFTPATIEEARDAVEGLLSSTPPSAAVPDGFHIDEIEDVIGALEAYEKTIDVGNVTGSGDDELIETDTAYAARFMRAVLAFALPQSADAQGGEG